MKQMTVLYLAKYAPNAEGQQPKIGEHDKTRAACHLKIHQILTTLFSKVISSSDVSVILSPPEGINYVFSLFNIIPMKNSEIFVSSVCESHKLPYLGAAPYIRALADDNFLTKKIAAKTTICVPQGVVYAPNEAISQPGFPPPYFVKPRFGAASHGIDEESICRDWVSAEKRIQLLLQQDTRVIVEQFIDGTHYVSSVINKNGEIHVLPSILEGNVVTYMKKKKIDGGMTSEICSDSKISTILKAKSKELFASIQPLDYAQFDYIIEQKTNTPYLFEINIYSNLGETSTLATAAKAERIGYEELIRILVSESIARQL